MLHLHVVEILLNIAKESVLEEIYRLTGYTGLKGGDISRISSSSDDDGLLGSYLDEALSQLGDILDRMGYVKEVPASDAQQATYVVTLQLPSNWKTELQAPLTKACTQLLYNYVCRQWFALTKKEDVEHYDGLCQSTAAVIRRLLCERRNPRRNQ